MDIIRRLATVSIIMVMILPTLENEVLASTPIDVTILVTNENDEPIQYVTIWGFQNPYDKYDSHLDLDMKSLWRVTTRHMDSYEFVSNDNNILPSLKILPMSNEQGRSFETINYTHSDTFPRPDKVTIGYTFIKRGYLPVKFQFEADESKSKYEVKIKLQHDSTIEMADNKINSYQKTFDRLRYELSDRRRNEELSVENFNRLESLRKLFKDTAQLALQFGDTNTASRIYYNLGMMPEVLILDGEAIGYRHINPDSQENIEAFQKAYELAPELLYIKMMTVTKEGQKYGSYNYSRKMSDELRKEFDDYLKKYLALLVSDGNELWPFYHLILVGNYKRVGLYNKAFIQLKHAMEFEPKYTDYAGYLKDMKIEMKLSKSPVPADWTL